MPIYFYYSNCYTTNNSGRLYSRWQVGRGDTSWDVGISDLIHKGAPRLDIAMVERTPFDRARRCCVCDRDEGLTKYSYFSVQRGIPLPWLHPLLQFKNNYDGLNFEYYCDPASGAREVSPAQTMVRKAAIKGLKDNLMGGQAGVQQPQICPLFTGRPLGSGLEPYATMMGSQ